MVASTFEGLIGKNILQIQEEEGWPEDSRLLVERALRGEEGAALHSFINVLNGETSKAISAYSPTRINGSFWSIWVSFPYEEIEKLVLPFRQNQIFALVVVLGGTLVLAAIYILGMRVSQKNGFLDGYHQARGRQGKKKKA